MSVVLLSGGTGGAKLARGLAELLGEELTVIANTGDDIELYGAYVSPDPDLITYWLADRIDARGWGLDGDTFATMDMLAELGEDVWFSLGDRDLAVCLARKAALLTGATLSETLTRLGATFALRSRVTPMSDDPVRTRIATAGGWVGLQEFLIRLRGAAPIEGVEFTGAASATPAPGVLEAIAHADAIVIGPSNPVLSIGPILAVPAIAAALADATAPRVAVSPIVAGGVIKGPTAACMRWAGVSVDAGGIASIYDGLIDGLLTDEEVAANGIRSARVDTNMTGLSRQIALARDTVDFASSLR